MNRCHQNLFIVSSLCRCAIGGNKKTVRQSAERKKRLSPRHRNTDTVQRKSRHCHFCPFCHALLQAHTISAFTKSKNEQMPPESVHCIKFMQMCQNICTELIQSIGSVLCYFIPTPQGFRGCSLFISRQSVPSYCGFLCHEDDSAQDIVGLYRYIIYIR